MPPDIWSALAEPKRREVLSQLKTRDCSVGELVDRLELPQPQVSKHLRVLREAGVVTVRVEAQQRIYAINPTSLLTLDEWLAPYRQLWNSRLDALGTHLESKKTKQHRGKQ